MLTAEETHGSELADGHEPMTYVSKSVAPDILRCGPCAAA